MAATLVLSLRPQRDMQGVFDAAARVQGRRRRRLRCRRLARFVGEGQQLTGTLSKGSGS
jgi:hypothetical protein